MFCWGCVFAPLSPKFWKWRSQNYPRGTSGAHRSLACHRTFECESCVENSHAKNNFFFTGIPVVVTAVLIGVLDFWTVLVLQCSDNTYRLSLWKWVPVNLLHSVGPMKTFSRSSAFKMTDGKKQKSTKLSQNFCYSAFPKEMPRLSGLGNQCKSTTCHSAIIPILAMHLIGRCNWNGKCYGKWCACRVPVPKSREVLQFFNTVYNRQ